MYDPKDVYLVTGGAGFIGSNFVRALTLRGARIVVLDALTYAGHLENLDGLVPEKVEFVRGDICDGPLVSRLMKDYGITKVVNFAAESHVDWSIEAPGEFIRTNVTGTFTLLSAALAHYRELDEPRRARFRFIHVSTDEVFGSLGPTGKFHERTPMAPNSPYAASKASADLLARAWHRTYGLPTITTNCSNNYGPRQFPEKLIPLMIQNAIRSLPLPVYGDGKNVRDWIHVDDHCAGILLAATHGRPGATYCFGGDAERTNNQVVAEITRALDDLAPRADGKPHASAIVYVADRPGHDHRYAIDDTLARSELGFSRRYTFETGLRATVAWYLEHQTWCDAVTASARGKTRGAVGLGGVTLRVTEGVRQ